MIGDWLSVPIFIQMIIGFLGKGGSGKSTLSTHFAKYLVGKGERVLAIDGDHNMDLTYNIRGNVEGLNFLGNAMSDLLKTSPNFSHYRDFLLAPGAPKFLLSPADPFTEKYSHPVTENLSIMTGGPHTDKVMFGQSCSHVLTTSLKAYLPLLKLNKNESVVLDEKAGSDGAGTGIVTGLTLAIICVEPTVHSVKAAHQIADLLDFFEVPYEFVLNKTTAPLANMLRKVPIAMIPFRDVTSGVLAGNDAFEAILKRGKQLETDDPKARFNRSKKKFERNREFSQEEN